MPFPDNGYLRLERFARDLKRRFVRGQVDAGSFALQMSNSPSPRLWLDSEAFVECDDACGYRIIVRTSDATRVIQETSDFASIDRFVGHYIVGKVTDTLSEALTS